MLMHFSQTPTTDNITRFKMCVLTLMNLMQMNCIMKCQKEEEVKKTEKCGNMSVKDKVQFSRQLHIRILHK